MNATKRSRKPSAALPRTRKGPIADVSGVTVRSSTLRSRRHERPHFRIALQCGRPRVLLLGGGVGSLLFSRAIRPSIDGGTRQLGRNHSPDRDARLARGTTRGAAEKQRDGCRGGRGGRDGYA